MSGVTVEQFQKLKARLEAATAAQAKAERDIAVAEAQLASLKKEIEAEYGKGSADVEKLKAIAEASSKEAVKIEKEVDGVLKAAGF